MGEATRDKQDAASEPKKDKQKAQGWIRMHTEEAAKPPALDEPKEDEVQARDPKVRKLEKPIQ